MTLNLWRSSRLADWSTMKREAMSRGALFAELALHGAGQDHRLVQDLGLDVGARQQTAEHARRGLPYHARPRPRGSASACPWASKKKALDMAGLLADQVDPVRALHDRIHDLRIGHDHVAQFVRQLDEDRLVAAELDGPRLRQLVRRGNAQHRAVIGAVADGPPTGPETPRLRSADLRHRPRSPYRRADCCRRQAVPSRSAPRVLEWIPHG